MTAATRAWADRLSTAVGHLLAGLDDAQRATATWPFPAEDERRRWYYTPTDHGGLPLHAMNVAQHRLVHRVLGELLSRPGYVTVAAILGLENVLDHLEGWRSDMDRDRGRDPLAYWVSVFGEPVPGGTWGWRFGGHHLSLHATIIDGEVVGRTPLFMGADPASAPLLGPHPHRPLGGVEDLGRELALSLDASQRSTAVLSAIAPPDLLGANRPAVGDGDRDLPLPEIWRGRLEGELLRAMAALGDNLNRGLGYDAEHAEALALTTRPKGLAATALQKDQREMLLALLGLYLNRLPEDVADEELAKVQASFDQLHFLWAGGLQPGEPHYYRIQGGPLLIEYDNAARQANHVHTVWRDLEADFGGDALARHYIDGGHRH
ncbi:MAG: DUF3500 domain-containing protein [Actinomycetota bacterium]